MAPVGSTTNSSTASPMETAMVPAISRLLMDSSPSSSSPDTWAEKDRAFMPYPRDSTRETTPRRKGFFRMGYRSLMLPAGFRSTVISPLGLRTATAIFPGPRIITPSMTAWPPTLNFLVIP